MTAGNGHRQGLADGQRRRLLQRAALAAMPGTWMLAPARASVRHDVFALGVASGPGADGGIVLWTRAAPDLVGQIERAGGLALNAYLQLRADTAARERKAPDIDVLWELAADESFSRIVRRGTATAPAALGHAVHVEIAAAELVPGRPYWYRFMLGDAMSPVGRTITLPAAGETPASYRVALASCQHYEYGHFGAYDPMRAHDPQAVIFVGDYVYEGGPRENRFRPHPFPSARTLFDYRLRHALYKRDPALQAMHAHCPWWLTWDDHEVSNDYARDVGEDPRIDGAARRHAAYQAYYEHMPLPAAALVSRFDHVRMYRQIRVGTLASVLMLDNRQYRDRQACQKGGRGGAGVIEDPPCTERRNPARTLLGPQQLAWFGKSLSDEARWTLIGQQTLFSPLIRPGMRSGTRPQYWSDGWDGYPAERERVRAAIDAAGPRNTVFLGGDLHMNWVCNVHRHDDTTSPVIATEFCGTSITSPSSREAQHVARATELNPHVKLVEASQRGFAVFDLGPDRMHATLRTVDDVRQPRPAASTLARFTVIDGQAGAQRD